jgi:osmotically-inducible protein OsmY
MGRQTSMQKLSTITLVSFSVFAALVLPGCAAYILGGETQQPQSQRSHSGSRSDNSIRYRINRRLVHDPEIRATGIRVRVNRGVVKLYGSVPSHRIKNKVISHASAVSGVRRVISRLRVTPR